MRAWHSRQTIPRAVPSSCWWATVWSKNCSPRRCFTSPAAVTSARNLRYEYAAADRRFVIPVRPSREAFGDRNRRRGGRFGVLPWLEAGNVHAGGAVLFRDGQQQVAAQGHRGAGERIQD